MRVRFFLASFFMVAFLAGKAEAAPVLVTNTHNAFAGSLRQAIQDANPGDTIVFQILTSDPGYNATTGTFTISLTSTATAGAGLVIDRSLTIDGGNQKIVVARNAAANFHIFRITAGPVTLSHLTIANGKEEPAAGSGSAGGGIANISGDLTLNNCTLTNNAAVLGAGAVHNAAGIFVANTCSFTGNSASTGGAQGVGALYLAGEAHISNSTFSGNSAQQASGAIYHATGPFTVDQCTFAQNSGPNAGAIENAGGGLTISNSTLSANTAGMAGGIINSSSIAAHARDNIIAGNSVAVSSHTDVEGSFVSDGYNFIGVVGASTGFGGAGSHDQVGTSMNPANPSLGALQNNGGPTLTMRPLPGSPVIDQGKSGGLPNDQRGQRRVADQSGIINPGGGDGSDIGAVEVGLPQAGPTFTVMNTFERDEGACRADSCTLLEALNATNANADANTINFAAGVSGSIHTGATQVGLLINNPVTINGPGARVLGLDGDGGPFGNRIFYVDASSVTISGLSLNHGYIDGFDGGAIYHNSGTLTLTDCTLANNFATSPNGGGAILNQDGTTLNLVRCTLYNNSTNSLGGAVYNGGIFTATNCTFFSNDALKGGAIISRFVNGLSNTTLRDCTITGCSASSTGITTGDGGGGLYAEGGAQQYHLANTIIAGNSSASNPPTNPDIRGQVTSDGHNFIGIIGNAMGLADGVNGDQVGTADFPKDAMFGSYANNGGPTDTIALTSGSTAINGGDDNLAPASDQRGLVRNGVSDIGAFEFGGTAAVLKINSITRLANGHVNLQAHGVLNADHTIEAASDPQANSFINIGTATSNGAGALQYDDAGAVGLTKRFYRLVFP